MTTNNWRNSYRKASQNTQTESDGNITYIPMKQKDNLVTWFKDLEKLRERIMQRLPDGIDKNEYELTKWSTMILHVRVESLRN